MPQSMQFQPIIQKLTKDNERLLQQVDQVIHGGAFNNHVLTYTKISDVTNHT